MQMVNNNNNNNNSLVGACTAVLRPLGLVVIFINISFCFFKLQISSLFFQVNLCSSDTRTGRREDVQSGTEAEEELHKS